jgi:hypothetical protein
LHGVAIALFFVPQNQEISRVVHANRRIQFRAREVAKMRNHRVSILIVPLPATMKLQPTLSKRYTCNRQSATEQANAPTVFDA